MRRAHRLALALLGSLTMFGWALPAGAQGNEDCQLCHEQRSYTRTFAGSVHASLDCTDCHAALAGLELPHDTPVAPVECGTCHSEEAEQHARSLHGRALARGDPLAPSCRDCHGKHDIRPVAAPGSPVAPLQIPFLCGRCHKEGTPVQKSRAIPQSHILENYSESIHGEGLLRKGLIVAPSCASCHTAHLILPHTDPESSISRARIATTCTRCHAQIEAVHRKVIRGELWEKRPHVLPACVDCHQPHKIRRVYYDQGAADRDCLVCHARRDLRAANGRTLFVDQSELQRSRHASVACAQCHSEVDVSRHDRACATITHGVACAACHTEAGLEYQRSIHGTLAARNDPNAPTCKECHGTHGVRGRLDPASSTFPSAVPKLCGGCHRKGQVAARRYTGPEMSVVARYTESIHGRGLIASGLTVTATCTSCHTAHEVLPESDPRSSVHRDRQPETCGHCHYGIEKLFLSSVHARKSDRPQPACADCHTAHGVRRGDSEGFRIDIMATCGRCHEAVARAYFDTYHGKVSQLGFSKTAKCHDCHGAHDILPPTDPRSHLSRQNVVATCRKCHAGATRRFAGYLTHATHHDPTRYPLLYWTFWGMTTLLVVTFVGGGLHTLLWLPRALALQRQRRALEAQAAAELKQQASKEPPPEGGEDGDT